MIVFLKPQFKGRGSDCHRASSSHFSLSRPYRSESSGYYSNNPWISYVDHWQPSLNVVIFYWKDFVKCHAQRNFLDLTVIKHVQRHKEAQVLAKNVVISCWKINTYKRYSPSWSHGSSARTGDKSSDSCVFSSQSLIMSVCPAPT